VNLRIFFVDERAFVPVLLPVIVLENVAEVSFKKLLVNSAV
jgi:hypothetical protein